MQNLILAADIGGTKTDLGLFERSDGAFRPVRTTTVPTSSYGSAASLLESFLLPDAPLVAAACLGVAGPVIAQEVSAPNLPWPVAARSLKRSLGLTSLVLVNDLVATAYGIEVLGPEKIHRLQRGRADPEGARALMAPGTGLGEAIMVREGPRYRPVPSEGGHANFAPEDEEQIELFRYLKTRGENHVSWEKVASGPALTTLHEFVVETGRGSSSEEALQKIAQGVGSAVIAELALARADLACELALDLYAALLGSEAGNLALKALSTGGLYLGGGVSPKILPKLCEGRFLEAFRAKGRMAGLMEEIPVNVITEPRTALLGAALRATLEP